MSDAEVAEWFSGDGLWHVHRGDPVLPDDPDRGYHLRATQKYGGLYPKDIAVGVAAIRGERWAVTFTDGTTIDGDGTMTWPELLVRAEAHLNMPGIVTPPS